MPAKRNPMYEDAYGDYLLGYSLEQVAEKYKVTRQRIFKAFRLRGFPMRGPNFQPIKEFDGKKFTLKKSGYYTLTTNDRISLHRYTWIFHKGPIPKGYDIHHKNEDKGDCDINNLECLKKADHTRHHHIKNKKCG